MFSNERPSPYGRQPYRQPYSQQPPRPFVQEDTLESGQVQIERKTFQLSLKENPRGRFLRITEHGGTKRTSIIIPATGLAAFKEMLEDMVHAANDTGIEYQPETMPEPEPEPAPQPAAFEPPAPELVTPVAPVAPVKPAKPVKAKAARKSTSEALKAKPAAAAKTRAAKVKSPKKKKK